MPETIENHVEFWQNTWMGRTAGEKIKGNQAKLYTLVTEILARGCFGKDEKLDIGCGPGLHAYIMSQLVPSWRDSWTGLDLSEVAITKAKSFGLNAFVADIYKYDGNGKKYGVFFLFDTLEHLFDHQALGEKIKSLGTDRYTIFGNIPLYMSESEGYERTVNKHTVAQFLKYAGCHGEMSVKIYGINSLPYMLFEASNNGKVRNLVVDIVKSISTLPDQKELTNDSR